MTTTIETRKGRDLKKGDRIQVANGTIETITQVVDNLYGPDFRLIKFHNGSAGNEVYVRNGQFVKVERAVRVLGTGAVVVARPGDRYPYTRDHMGAWRDRSGIVTSFTDADISSYLDDKTFILVNDPKGV